MKKPKIITADEWLDATFPTPEPIPENAFTVEMAVAKSKLCRQVVNEKLNRMVADGKLIKRKALVNGRHINYYIPSK